MVIRALAWGAVAGMGGVSLTQALGRTGLPPVYVAQALTPYVLAPSVPLAVGAAVRGERALAATAAGVAASLVWLTAPVVLHRGPAAPAPGAPRVRVAHANAYFRNERPADAAAALLAADADVLAVTEESPELERALRDRGVHDRYPHERSTPSDRRNGVALYSRYPFAGSAVAPVGHQTGIDAVLQVGDRQLRVLVVHPLPGSSRDQLRDLRADLAAFTEAAAGQALPTVVVGDFNASRWHPLFRRVLRHLTDAHEAVGRGWSVSWPMGRRVVPPFVRLDHALFDTGLTALAAEDVDVPGSDHRGFVVELSWRGAVSG